MMDENQKIVTALARKTAKSASFIVSGKILSMIIQVFMFIVVARLLTPNGYGVYTLALSAAAFVGAFGSLNIGTYFNERIPFLIAKKRAKEIGVELGDATVAVIVPGIALLAAGIALSVPLSEYVLHSAAYYPVMILAMATILFNFVYGAFNTILIGFHDAKNSSIGAILYSMLQAAFSIGLVYLAATPMGRIEGAIAGYIIALVISSIFQIYVSGKPYGISFVRKGMGGRVRSMLKFSMPLTYSNIIGTMVTNFSVIFLGLVVLPTFVGYYGVASRVGTIIDVVAGSIGIVLIPTFAEAINNRNISKKVDRFFYYSIYFGLLFTTPMIAYVTVFAHALITTLFSGAYGTATIYMQLIGIGLLLGIFGSFATQLVISTGRTGRVFRYGLYVGIIEVIALIVLTPTLHVIGLIVAMLYVGGMATNIFFMRYLKELGVSVRLSKPIRILASNLILGLVLSLLFLLNNPEAMLVAGVVVIVLLYPVIVAKLGALSEDDANVLSDSAAEIPLVGRGIRAILFYARLFL